jgi:inner membrane protein
MKNRLWLSLMGLTHVVFSLFLFLVSWRFGLVSPEISVLLGFVVGSVLPDLDHPRGLLYGLLRVPSWLRRGVSQMVGQRGILHSLFVSLILLALCLMILNAVFQFAFVISLGIFAGYLSHLFLDSLTVQGVAWLLPFSHRKLHYVIRTDSIYERILLLLLIVASIVLGYPLAIGLVDYLSKEIGKLLSH